jgi:AAA15 family ATPase/GTPase
MVLKEFSCTYQPIIARMFGRALEFEEIDLQKINLIVGKNSSGKSMLVDFIIELSKARQFVSAYPSWSFSFEDGMDLLKYEVNFVDRGNFKESLTINNEERITRHNNKTIIYSEITKKVEDISPPGDELVIYTRRDQKAYPYIERIINWANSIHFFKFGLIHPNSFLGYNKG